MDRRCNVTIRRAGRCWRQKQALPARQPFMMKEIGFMKKRLLAVLLAFSLLGALTACQPGSPSGSEPDSSTKSSAPSSQPDSSGPDESGASTLPVRADIAPVYPAGYAFEDYDAWRKTLDDNPVEDAFLKAVRAFSTRSASAVLSGAKDNANFSPISLYYALALAGTGAAGETQRELLELLGAEDCETLSIQCGNLFRQLYTDNSVTQLRLANSLWLAPSYAWKDAFLQNAADQFYASAYRVDFSSPSAGQAMGQWVADQTKGTLAPAFPVSEQQILSILNTVYFYDEWTDRFDASKTSPDTFTLADGSTVQCDFMNATYTSHGFVRGENYTSSTLGLKGSGSMLFVLPDEGVGVDELLSDPDTLAAILTNEGGSMGEVVFQVPKFSYDSKFDLADALQSLGVQAAFGDQADFSNMTDGDAFISRVEQQTHIAVNENGVEASAFTNISMAGAAMPTGRAEMLLNRPFLYVITAGSGVPLFVGVCQNPAAEPSDAAAD